MAKPKERIKSAEELEKETEFYRRMNLANETKYVTRAWFQDRSVSSEKGRSGHLRASVVETVRRPDEVAGSEAGGEAGEAGEARLR